MAICIEFQLVELHGDIAIYRYNECRSDEFGLVELNIPALLSGAMPADTPMIEAVRLLPSALMSQWRANRVFSKVHKHYSEHQAYPQRGGYYA